LGEIGLSKIIKIRLSLRILLLCIKLDKDTWSRVFKFIKTLPKKQVNVASSKSQVKMMSILSICVSNKMKGKGVSKALVEDFEKQLTERGIDGYTLSVKKTNERAIAFYKKMNMNIYTESEYAYGFKKLLKE